MDGSERTCQNQFIKEEPRPILTKEEKKQIYNRRFLAKLKSDEEKYASFRLLERERLKQYRRTLSDEKKAKAKERRKFREKIRDNQPKKHKSISEKNLAIRREQNRLAQRKRRANMNPERKNRERQRNLTYMNAKRKQKVKDVDSACKTNLTTSLRRKQDQTKRTCQNQFIKVESQPILAKEEKKRLCNRRFLAKLKSDEEKYASFRLLERERLKQYRRTLSDEKKAKAKDRRKLREKMRGNQPKKHRSINEKNLAIQFEQNRLAQRKRRANMDPEKKNPECNMAYINTKRMQKVKDGDRACKTNLTTPLCRKQDQPKRTCQGHPIKDEPQLTLKKTEQKQSCSSRHCLAKLKSDEKEYASLNLQERERLKQYRRNVSDKNRAKAMERTGLRNIENREGQKEMRENLKKFVREENKKAKRREQNRLAQRKRRANMDPEKKNQERERNLAYMQSKRKQKEKGIDMCETNITTSSRCAPDWTKCKSTCQGQIIKEESPPTLSKKEEKQLRNRHWLARLKSDEGKYASFRLKERERLKQYRRFLSDEKRTKARERRRLRIIEWRKRQKIMKENTLQMPNNNVPVHGKDQKAVSMILELKRE